MSLTVPGETIVSEPGVTYQTDGGVIWLEQTGPSYGSFYGFDICRRVKHVKLVGEINPAVFDHLCNFNDLENVWLDPYYRLDHGMCITELILKSEEFRKIKPSVNVEVSQYDATAN